MFGLSFLVVVAVLSDGTYCQKSTKHTVLTRYLIREQDLHHEEHTVQTSDDYILRMYRILNDHDSRLPPMLLVHGMFTSSEDYFIGGNTSYANMATKAGFDVWLTNLRFTEIAKHAIINRDNEDYWDFGFEEHAAIDVPECIDYVLNATSSKSVILVTLSSGSPLYIMMLNERPDMVSKVAAHVALAPAFFFRHHQEFLRLLHDLLEFISQYGFGRSHFARYGDLSTIPSLCAPKPPERNICMDIIFWFYGEDRDQINWEVHNFIFSRYLAFTNKHIRYILQTALTGVLSKFDYGSEKNLLKYGTKIPPSYDWSTGIAPNLIYFGKNDKVVTKADMKMITKNLRTSKAKVVVKQPKYKFFSHFDIVMAINATIPIFQDAIFSLKKIFL